MVSLDEEAALVTASIGLDEPRHSQGGDDGRAFYLADGRILKLTSSMIEAAICLALLDLQAADISHPCVPRIDDVRWYAVDGGTFSARRYAIVREAFDDLAMDKPERGTLSIALTMVNRGRGLESTAWAQEGLALWTGGPQIADVLEGLDWLERETGVVLEDVRTANLGVSRSGRTGMRDLGRGIVPQHLLARVEQRQFRELRLLVRA